MPSLVVGYTQFCIAGLQEWGMGKSENAEVRQC